MASGELAQFAPQNFTHIGFRQLIAKLDKLWHLVSGEVLAAKLSKCGLG